MRLFAERGFDATSIRDVAAAAGVSSSLVVHHFKTKARLKEATDARLISALASMIAELPTGEGADFNETAGSMAEVLRDVVEQVIGVDPLGPVGMRQWGAVVMEVYTGGIYAHRAPPPDATPRAPQETAATSPPVTPPDATLSLIHI